MILSNRNQFLYDRDLLHERVNEKQFIKLIKQLHSFIQRDVDHVMHNVPKWSDTL